MAISKTRDRRTRRVFSPWTDREARGPLECLEPRALLTGTLSWVGTNSFTQNWSNPANWTPSRAPTTGDDLVFSAIPGRAFPNTSTTDDVVGLSVKSISFSSSLGWTVGGTTDLTIESLSGVNGGINVTPATGSRDGNPTIIKFNPGSLTLNNPTTVITLPNFAELDLLGIGHKLQGAGAFVTSSGSNTPGSGGNLVLLVDSTGTKTYTGTPAITSGKITIGVSSGLIKGTKLANSASMELALKGGGAVSMTYKGTAGSPSIFDLGDGYVSSNVVDCSFFADTITGNGTLDLAYIPGHLGDVSNPVGTVAGGTYYLGAGVGLSNANSFITTVAYGTFFIQNENVFNSTAAATLTVDDPGSGSFYIYSNAKLTVDNAVDRISQAGLGYSGTFAKQGKGNLTLFNSSISFAGDVMVNGGIMTFGVAKMFPDAASLTVAGGAGLNLNGTGTFTPDGPVTLSPNSTYTANVGATTADQVFDPKYGVTYAGANLNLRLSSIPPVGNSFTLISSGPLHPLTGTFAGLPNNTVFTAGGAPFQIHYTSTSVFVTRVAAATIVDVTSSLSSSTYGQAVTFTSTFTTSPGSPAPTGTAQFQVDGVNLGTAVAISGGVATSTATGGIAAGSHVIRVLYSGDSIYASSGALTGQVVAMAPLTVTANSLSIGHGDSIPALTATLSGFVNGDTAGVVTGTASLATTATSTSPAGFYPITVGAGTLSASNYSFTSLVNGTLTVQPKILDVRANYGGKSISILGLARDLPFLNIASIDVIFSDKVNAASASLALTGANSYGFSGFSYNSTTNDARYTLPSAIGVDKLLASLDAQVGTTAGSVIIPLRGTTSFGFSVLPGDVDGDGAVTILDAVTTLNNTARGTVLSTFADLEGTGVVTAADYLTVRKRIGTHL